jgi:hypothetical protein
MTQAPIVNPTSPPVSNLISMAFLPVDCPEIGQHDLVVLETATRQAISADLGAIVSINDHSYITSRLNSVSQRL